MSEAATGKPMGTTSSADAVVGTPATAICKYGERTPSTPPAPSPWSARSFAPCVGLARVARVLAVRATSARAACFFFRQCRYTAAAAMIPATTTATATMTPTGVDDGADGGADGGAVGGDGGGRGGGDDGGGGGGSGGSGGRNRGGGATNSEYAAECLIRDTPHVSSLSEHVAHVFEPLNVPKNRLAYAQPLVARQLTAQASLASSRDWYSLLPLKSVLRWLEGTQYCPAGHWTASSQCGAGVGGGGDGGGGGGDGGGSFAAANSAYTEFFAEAS